MVGSTFLTLSIFFVGSRVDADWVSGVGRSMLVAVFDILLYLDALFGKYFQVVSCPSNFLNSIIAFLGDSLLRLCSKKRKTEGKRSKWKYLDVVRLIRFQVIVVVLVFKINGI